MIRLNSRPVFGYEYETCNAKERRMIDLRQMPAYAQKSDAELENIAKVSYWAANFFKVLGAFVPVVGVARIIYAVAQNDEQLGKEVLRGLAELLGAGLFMIAIDVAVTVYREYEALKPQYVI